jgi:hypothetical protein
MSLAPVHKAFSFLLQKSSIDTSATMISEQNIPSLLMIVVLLISLVRLFILYHFGSKWSAYKIDYAVGATSCILFAVLSGLFWSKEIPAWRQVLLWVSTILPPLQAVGLVRSHIELVRAYHVAVSPYRFPTTQNEEHTTGVHYRVPHFLRVFKLGQGGNCAHWSSCSRFCSSGWSFYPLSRLPWSDYVVSLVDKI